MKQIIPLMVNGDTYEVVYSFTGNKLMRSLTINNGAPEQLLAAQFINTNASATTCSYTGGILTFTVTAKIDAESETRTYQIKNRSS